MSDTPVGGEPAVPSWAPELARVHPGRRARFLELAQQLWMQRLASMKAAASLVRGDIETLSFSREGMIIEVSDGARFLVDPASCDSTSLGLLLQRGSYEPAEGQLLRRLVRRGDVVVDAGANVGWHTIKLSQLVGAAGLVVACEPIAESFAMLETNIELNAAENVRCFNVAVSSVPGPGTVFCPTSRLTRASLMPVVSESEQRTCAIATIDELTEGQGNRVTLIKLDVEGAELPALLGAEKVLADARPAVLMEFSEQFANLFGYGREDVCRFFERLGYRLTQVATASAESPGDRAAPTLEDGTILAVAA